MMNGPNNYASASSNGLLPDFLFQQLTMPAVSAASVATAQSPAMATAMLPMTDLRQQQQPQPNQQLSRQVLLEVAADDASSPYHQMKFPFKLFHLLTEAERCGFSHIISWIPTGDGFRVHDPKAFAKTIMPKFFGMSHYKSFQRQLSLYSFKRANDGIKRDAYMHPCFLRSNRELCNFIPREKKKTAHQQQLLPNHNSDTKQGPSNRPETKKNVQNEVDVDTQQHQQAQSQPTSLPISASSPQEEEDQEVQFPGKLGEPRNGSIANHPSGASTWMREHDQWLSYYVSFLVFGDKRSALDSSDSICSGAFVPDLQNKENVSLEDVCDEIVLTFGHH
mmetsp:Transcript_4522/g.8355  ORF Transcript_4522/g.8355 Transcript_4522/m.8355 type:complete len:335 (-) Transcript_4522:595-1599(-)